MESKPDTSVSTEDRDSVETRPFQQKTEIVWNRKNTSVSTEDRDSVETRPFPQKTEIVWNKKKAVILQNTIYCGKQAARQAEEGGDHNFGLQILVGEEGD